MHGSKIYESFNEKGNGDEMVGQHSYMFVLLGTHLPAFFTYMCLTGLRINGPMLEPNAPVP